MSSQVIKIRIKGRKNQVYGSFINIPNKIKTKGPFVSKLGHIDMGTTNKTRFISLNILKIMFLFYYGCTPTNKIVGYLYNYFLSLSKGTYWSYFDVSVIKKSLQKKDKIYRLRKKKKKVFYRKLC